MKLIVVACNTATSAALPQLQEELRVPVVGVITPGGARRGAGDAQPPRRPARDRRRRSTAGRYAELVHALDAGVSFHPVACPRLVPLIEGDDPYGEETEAAVREYAAPLQAAGVDTVILGCTHYPLIRPIFERVFGRDVTLVFSAEETAREVAETLARKGIENDAAARARTASSRPATRRRSASSAAASSSCRSREVEHVTRGDARRSRRMSTRRTAASRDQLRALYVRAGLPREPARLGR